MYFDGSSISCGAEQIIEVGTVSPSSFVKQVKRHLKESDWWDGAERNPTRCFLFSDVVKKSKSRGGSAVAAYLKKNRIGTLYPTRAFVNYNSGNKIQCFMWIPPANWYTDKNKNYGAALTRRNAALDREYCADFY